MIIRRNAALVLVMLAGLAGAASARAQDLYQGPIGARMSPEFTEWYHGHFQRFTQQYMEPTGRIFDPENGGISHSESQAYGMAIALAADDASTFDLIWRWTRTHLRNSDGLHAWKYVPGQGVTDRNNATDADLIIAAILSVAARRWDRGDYLAAAVQTATALGRNVLIRHRGHVLMLPGKVGFVPPSQPDGPVVNLSYYHFDLMKIVSEIAPDQPWAEAAQSGFYFYERVLANWSPSDWTSVADPDNPKPARNFPRRASYDAIRAPINLLSVPETAQRDIMTIIDDRWDRSGGIPGIYDPVSRQRVGDLKDPGYRLIAAVVDCVADANPVPAELLDFRPTTYFASALHLMMIHQLYIKHPGCIRF